ncbi:hypothetical protein L2E82_08906 [Cichorium intybus]|uniref:Uncharacterized protein n=1 Tax=Cichorium intybus TaxID=13427 RepID=A0ACB9G765_CICIN|nr:hypothetical protein L2E82_08906 [Cichorium intybus]
MKIVEQSQELALSPNGPIFPVKLSTLLISSIQDTETNLILDSINLKNADTVVESRDMGLDSKLNQDLERNQNKDDVGLVYDVDRTELEPIIISVIFMNGTEKLLTHVNHG